ncbi:phosphate signaling complex protein PhoU [bacterium]|nr:phosphate signaling complex protein PhoU [candidate division CSSED10-310 bacterium]
MLFQLRREIEILKNRILLLGAEAEKIVAIAIKSLKTHDVELAKSVLDLDLKIDRMEVDIEEECLKILALHQPVAIDLRFIVAILKMNNDLERIGDLAVNIALRSAKLAAKRQIHLPREIFEMAELSETMLKQCLDALINMDETSAREVCKKDDQVDDLHTEMFSTIEAHFHAEATDMKDYIRILEISHQLERIADLATNIAEDVIYLASGHIIRHGTGKDTSRESGHSGLTA